MSGSATIELAHGSLPRRQLRAARRGACLAEPRSSSLMAHSRAGNLRAARRGACLAQPRWSSLMAHSHADNLRAARRGGRTARAPSGTRPPSSAYAHLAEDYEALQLLPVAPLGVCSVLAPTSQTARSRPRAGVKSSPIPRMCSRCCVRSAWPRTTGRPPHFARATTKLNSGSHGNAGKSGAPIVYATAVIASQCRMMWSTPRPSSTL